MPERPELLHLLASDIREASPEPNEATRAEDDYLDRELDRQLKREQIRSWQQYNEALQQNNTERKKYARYIFLLTCIWALVIFVVLFLEGCGVMRLSDQVIITLITSTTINFFGFFLLVTKYLFNTNEHRLAAEPRTGKKGFWKTTG